MKTITAIGVICFCLAYSAKADFTTIMNGFQFDHVNNTFSCSVTGTGDASSANSASGTFTVVSLPGNISHVFITGTSKAAPYNVITINGSMLVNHGTKALASSSMETTFQKNANDKKPIKYTVVSSGTFSAADFSDLQLNSTGTVQ